jgi:DNA (cytosine-5)-methyltransferase 1
MRTLDCFSGLGGGIIASKILGHRIVCAIETNQYCQDILVHHQNAGDLEPFPIWDDIATFNGKEWKGSIDLVQGGFPCQDISAAGNKIGISGQRSGLWKEMFRIICEVRPCYVFVENVADLLIRGVHVVLADLSAAGFDAEWSVLSASSVGAGHKRNRLWILAKSKIVPHTIDLRCRRLLGQKTIQRDFWNRQQTDEPDVACEYHGIPNRLDAYRGFGNAQVPLCAAMAFSLLYQRLNGKR